MLSRVTCPVCGELLKNREELKRHMSTHSADEKLSCMEMEFSINPLESPKAFGVARNLIGIAIFFLLLLACILMLYLMGRM